MLDRDRTVEQLYILLCKKMCIYATHTTKNKHIAEELVQDTFFILIKKWPFLENHPNINGWLWRTLSNLILSERKAKKHMVELPILEQEIAVVDQYELDTFKDFLPMQLSIYDRQILTLFYECQFTISEISRMFNTNNTVIKTRLCRARQRCKRYLFEETNYKYR